MRREQGETGMNESEGGVRREQRETGMNESEEEGGEIDLGKGGERWDNGSREGEKRMSLEGSLLNQML